MALGLIGLLGGGGPPEPMTAPAVGVCSCAAGPVATPLGLAVASRRCGGAPLFKAGRLGPPLTTGAGFWRTPPRRGDS
eukprot:3662744-Alexandrium_andersonii.AAC.1